MKINTFTAIAGNSACNAKCPYCISQMTPKCDINRKRKINMRNFKVACRLAEKSGASTMLITGKGEPLLFQDEVEQYCIVGGKYFPVIELQTNGVAIEDDYDNNDGQLMSRLYDRGLVTVSISIAHYDNQRNEEIFQTRRAFNIWRTVDYLRQNGFSVRINCTMVKGYVDNRKEVTALLSTCREYGVEQVTLRPLTVYEDEESNADVVNWSKAHLLNDSFMHESCGKKGLPAYLRNHGKHILDLPHGGKVYDVEGQNVCYGNCLTSTKDSDDIRQLIYFPDGHLRYDWKYKGAIIF